MTAQTIARELRLHVPFAGVGTVTGILLMVLIVRADMPRDVSATVFGTFHPTHVFLSALVTAGMYRLHGNRGLFLFSKG